MGLFKELIGLLFEKQTSFSKLKDCKVIIKGNTYDLEVNTKSIIISTVLRYPKLNIRTYYLRKNGYKIKILSEGSERLAVECFNKEINKLENGKF